MTEPRCKTTSEAHERHWFSRWDKEGRTERVLCTGEQQKFDADGPTDPKRNP